MLMIYRSCGVGVEMKNLFSPKSENTRGIAIGTSDAQNKCLQYACVSMKHDKNMSKSNFSNEPLWCSSDKGIVLPFVFFSILAT